MAGALEKDNYIVRGSTMQALRYLSMQCRYCRQAVTGRYGRYDAQGNHQEARQKLSEFVVDKDADGAGEV